MDIGGIDFIERHDAPDDVVGYRLTGKLTLEGYEAVMDRIREVAARHGKAKLLFEIPSFQGAEPAVFWQKIKDMKDAWHLFGSIAVVADQRWLEVWAKLADPVTPMHIKQFRDSEMDAAWQWLAGE